MTVTAYVVIDDGTALGAYLERYQAELHQMQLNGPGSLFEPVTVSEVEIELPEWMCS